jgi:hypothetical protein
MKVICSLQSIWQVNVDLERILLWSQTHWLWMRPKLRELLFQGWIWRWLRTLSCLVPFSDSIRRLELFVDSRLSWETHVSWIVGRVFVSLKLQNRLRKYIRRDSQSLRLYLFRTLVIPFRCRRFPVINWSCVWFDSVEVAFNACVRYMFNLGYFDHVSGGNNLNVLKLNKLEFSYEKCLQTMVPIICFGMELDDFKNEGLERNCIQRTDVFKQFIRKWCNDRSLSSRFLKTFKVKILFSIVSTIDISFQTVEVV